MKTLKYAAGSYVIKVASWENDVDHERTEETVAGNLKLAQSIYDFCQIFNEHGNLYDPTDAEHEAVKAAFVAFAKTNPVFFGDEQPEDEEQVVDWCMDKAYGLGLTCGEQYTRQLDYMTVEHMLHDVYVTDVTQDFAAIKINHRPSIADIELVAAHYSKKDGVEVVYVCSSEVSGNNTPCDLYYRATPHPEFGNKYFALYQVVGLGLRIAGADSIEDEVFAMVDNGGVWEYSRYRHDYHTFDGNFVDGGRAYYRGSLPCVDFVVRNGKFVKKES
jgi:hypothetical protein